jgi:membrane associated rhomboid family serine protease
MYSKHQLYSSLPLSYILIGISVIIAICGFVIPGFQDRFGMNQFSLMDGKYIQFIVQIILFQFLHGDILHLLMNSYFLYTAGPMVESRMSRDRFLWFFAATTIFLTICLSLFSPNATTIGISGFCMALLSYLWIDLYTAKHPMANQILIMLVLNIGLGFV